MLNLSQNGYGLMILTIKTTMMKTMMMMTMV